MFGFVGKLMLLLAMLGLWAIGMFVVLPTTGVFKHDDTPAQTATPVPHHGATPQPRSETGQRALERVKDHSPSHTVVIVGLTLLLIALPLTGIGMVVIARMRVLARRRRKYVRLRVTPARGDQAAAEDIVRMLGSWHQQLLQPWYRRVLRGQAGLALEVVTAPDSEGDVSARLSIVCPVEHVGAIEGSMLACYQDARLGPEDELLPPVDEIVRLQKRTSFVRALRTPDREERNTIDSVLAQMVTLDAPAIVQFALVPTPSFFDSYSRARFKSVERSSERSRLISSTEPGLRSQVLGAELVGGLQVQHRPLFFADIRVAARDYESCRAIAGVIRGESTGENRLTMHRVRQWARGPMYITRLRAGLPNPFPDFNRGVLSSTELAMLWHLPSPGLRTVRVARSPVPRLPAPPEISRAPEHALARDDRGLVGIRPEDKTDGIGLIGGQKTGKTSLLCRTVEADARDDTCCLIVLMPKPGDALKSLSMIPPGRTVHYLDLERPEFGINPLLAVGDASMVADKVVEAFRDVHMEGDIRGSSDRYLRQAAQAAIGASRNGAIEGPPTLWHMYRMLLPAEEAFRERVVHSIMPDPRFTETATFFGRELPSDLIAAASQTAAKLDAPRNKLLRLLVESLDKVLRHPRQMSLDQIVRDREVLIVDGKMGTFGPDNCRVMMQFILNMLYGTLQRQQQLPEEQRVRVALKVDEAHLILNESFANALATLRSAGLEVVAAWQYGDQIQDEKIRSGMMSLLRQRCMFSMGESTDARDMSNIAMSVYADMIRTDSESRSQMRVTPDMIFNLPNHHAICSWISRGARAPAFLCQTMPLEYDEQVTQRHLEAQRERGGYVPDRLPDPLPDFEAQSARDFPSQVISGGAPPATPVPVAAAVSAKTDSPAVVEQPAEPGAEFVFEPGENSVDDSKRKTPKRNGGPPPESYTELDLDSVRGITWSDVTPVPHGERHEPTHRELEILAALWSYRVMFATQIKRRWWQDSSLRAAQQGLNRMMRAGWVRRFRFRLEERGAQQGVYALTREGFELAQKHRGPRGAYINPKSEWREPQLNDPRRVLRDLHVNGWVIALEQIAGKRIVEWRGQRDSRLEPPRRRTRGGEWIAMKPSELSIGTSTRLRDFEPVEFEPITPDASVEFRIPVGDNPIRFDLLIEIDRARSASARADRLRKYDGLIAGWSSTHERYRTLGAPPVVVFVCEDEPSRDALVKLADRTVVARHAKPGTEEAEWPAPTRRSMFFVVERDIHEGSLAAQQLPERPPDVRVRLDGRDARALRPWEVHIIEPRLLRGR